MGNRHRPLAPPPRRPPGHPLGAQPREAQQIVAPAKTRLFLPGFPIPPEIAVTGDDAAVADAEIVVSVIPSEFLRPTLARIRPYLHPGQIIVSATKGVEDHTFLRMTQVIAASLAETARNPRSAGCGPKVRTPISKSLPKTTSAPQVSSSKKFIGATLSPHRRLQRPSFALEVAQGQPTAVTVAFDDPEIAARIQQEFSSETLRLYTSTDVIGVELGGALKNVIAIAAGVAAGVGLGHNSAAALITRGIAEITRLAVACGGRRETLAGLSGVGDLVLTCTGSLSRNRTVGQALGQGRKLPEILESLGRQSR
jgi:glycerol-3-phosphate dehydrogenase (NAD(P)+)